MRNFDPAKSFGHRVAAHYDDAPRGDEAETIDFLERWAHGGPALELAIGTGRIGLPLSQRGIRLDGIELSEAMVEQLRKKPGGDRIAVTMGDYAEVAVDGTYKLVFVVFNTFYNLLTQDNQVRCFENVAKHLTRDGVFIIEAATPNEFFLLRNGQYVDAEAVEVDRVTLDVARFDPVTQCLDESHVSITETGITLAPIVTRYVWPSELDLMARIAGLRLHARYGGWFDEPFTADSRRHVSVYGW
ncbi:MAG: class I SAM-dependent methyltransferase [Thermomicrobiales bacterium]|nr:class I SAM-dependent methyltransferase [Thermomicrobiales bacterium]MCO5223509.1 class I SAM-dependent methyltransferase [Thermomicrobiales bacterium]